MAHRVKGTVPWASAESRNRPKRMHACIHYMRLNLIVILMQSGIICMMSLRACL